MLRMCVVGVWALAGACWAWAGVAWADRVAPPDMPTQVGKPSPGEEEFERLGVRPPPPEPPLPEPAPPLRSVVDGDADGPELARVDAAPKRSRWPEVIVALSVWAVTMLVLHRRRRRRR